MIRLQKVSYNDFEMKDILGNVIHVKSGNFHIKMDTYPGGMNFSFSNENVLYDIDIFDTKKRPDLIENVCGDTLFLLNLFGRIL